MLSASEIISESEKDRIIKELSARNEIILERHKKSLEIEFKRQMRDILVDISHHQRGNIQSISPPKSRVNGAVVRKLKSRQLYREARHAESAPQLLSLGGSDRVAVTQAAPEFKRAPATAVSRNTGLINNGHLITNEAKFLGSDAIVRNNEETFDGKKGVSHSLFSSDSGTGSESLPRVKTASHLEMHTAKIYLNANKQRAVTAMTTVKSSALIEPSLVDTTNLSQEYDRALRRHKLPVAIDKPSQPRSAPKPAESSEPLSRMDMSTQAILLKSHILVQETSASRRGPRKHHRAGTAPAFARSDIVASDSSEVLPPVAVTTNDSRIVRKVSFAAVADDDHEDSDKPPSDDTPYKVAATKVKPSQSDNLPRFEGDRSRPSTTLWQGRTVTAHGEREECGPARRKSEWENEIARHIISVYASTQTAVEDQRGKTPAESRTLSKAEMLLRFTTPVEGDKAAVVSELLRDSTGPAPPQSDLVKEALCQAVTPNSNKANSDGTLQRFEETTGPVSSGVHKKAARPRPTFAVRTRKGVDLVVRGPPRCQPIWFVATGDVYADWTTMPEGGAALQAQLTALFERGEYMQYLETAEAALSRAIARLKLSEASLQEKDPRFLRTTYAHTQHRMSSERAHKRLTTASFESSSSCTEAPAPRPPPSLGDESVGSFSSLTGRRPPSAGIHGLIGSIREENSECFDDLSLKDTNAALKSVIPFWEQLVATANAFGTLCVEKKQVNKALLLLKFAEVQCGRNDILPRDVRLELRAHVCSAMGFFFYHRRKTRAAVSRINAAIDAFHRLGPGFELEEALAMLRLAACEAQASDYKAAHKVLAMAESGDLLAKQATNPRQLCVVAVAYHNLAVVQLQLQDAEAACRSSMNARKLSRLCLSYSNRWLSTFQHTHQTALEDVQYRLRIAGGLDRRQNDTLEKLTDSMFDPDDV